MTEMRRRFQSQKRSRRRRRRRRRRGNKRARVAVVDMTPICSEMCSSYSRYEERRRAEGVEFARANTTTTPLDAEKQSCAQIVEPSIAASAVVITEVTPPTSPDEDSNEASTSSTENNDTQDEDRSMTPSQLLQLSIRKRRALEKCKERPLDRELFLTGTIARLCTHIGEERARRRQERREAKRRREQFLDREHFEEVSDFLLNSFPHHFMSPSKVQ